MNQIVSYVLVLALTLLSGVLDARGFVYAARAWPGGQFDWRAGSISILAFFGGLSLYVISVRFMQSLGVQSVALQSAVWFVITAIGIAIMDGSVVQWTRTQQVVAVVVVVALTWLLSSIAGHEH